MAQTHKAPKTPVRCASSGSYSSTATKTYIQNVASGWGLSLPLSGISLTTRRAAVGLYRLFSGDLDQNLHQRRPLAGPFEYRRHYPDRRGLLPEQQLTSGFRNGRPWRRRNVRLAHCWRSAPSLRRNRCPKNGRLSCYRKRKNRVQHRASFSTVARLPGKSNFPIIPGSIKILPGSVTIIPD